VPPHDTHVISNPHAGASVAYCRTCTWLRLAPDPGQADAEAALHVYATGLPSAA